MAITGNPTPGNDFILGDALANFIDALAGNELLAIVQDNTDVLINRDLVG